MTVCLIGRMGFFERIQQRQRERLLPGRHYVPPTAHLPQALYIGCIDARLDPIDDIGFEKGEALIFRNIGALVPSYKPLEDASWLALEELLSRGEIPQHVGLGAALEIFLGHLPALHGQPKHIIVAAHTDCAGLKTCHHRDYRPQDRCLPHYLENLRGAHEEVLRQAEGQGLSDEQLLHALEEAAVRQSIANLQDYPVVAEALASQRLKLHGWVNDTASGLIRELNPHTGLFQPMSEIAA